MSLILQEIDDTATAFMNSPDKDSQFIGLLIGILAIALRISLICLPFRIASIATSLKKIAKQGESK